MLIERGTWMKRHSLWMIILIITLGLLACKKAEVADLSKAGALTITPAREPVVTPIITIDEPISSDYQVLEQKLNLGDRITGSYPQIDSSLEERRKRAKINQLILEDIMSFIEAFNESDVTLEISYDVPWKSESIKHSILYVRFCGGCSSSEQ